MEAKIPTGVPEDLIEGELFKLRSRTVKALEVYTIFMLIAITFIKSYL